MVKNKNIEARRLGAYERLRVSEFFEKGKRTVESWQKRKDKELEILKKRVNVK
jgi:hypothetical protein